MDAKLALNSAIKKNTVKNHAFDKADSVISTGSGRVGRPKKKNKRNVPLSILLTQEESDKLTEKAGLTAKGTFIRSCLQEAGIF